MSICSFSESFLALSVGLTLNPTIIASDAEASKTSDSVIAPTPLKIILT